MTDTAEWFEKVREAARNLVDENKGAILVTREELCDVLRMMNDDLMECPSDVLDHFTCGLWRKSLASCAYRYPDGSILVIHDMRIETEAAKKICKKRGFSKAVKAALEKESVIA